MPGFYAVMAGKKRFALWCHVRQVYAFTKSQAMSLYRQRQNTACWELLPIPSSVPLRCPDLRTKVLPVKVCINLIICINIKLHIIRIMHINVKIAYNTDYVYKCHYYA